MAPGTFPSSMSKGSRRRSCPWKPLSSISSSAFRRRFSTCRLLQPTAGHARQMGRETAASEEGTEHAHTEDAGQLPPGTWDKYVQTDNRRTRLRPRAEEKGERSNPEACRHGLWEPTVT